MIPILESDGYTVIAVQNPLTSLADDIATTKRVIDAQKGPVVVVGHSYGGAVITAAAAGSAKRQGPRLRRGIRAGGGRSPRCAGCEVRAAGAQLRARPRCRGFSLRRSCEVS